MCDCQCLSGETRREDALSSGRFRFVPEAMSKAVTSIHGSRVIADKSITWTRFIFVAYFCVCGGSFGFEEAVGNAGPALTLLLTCVIPLVWCLPLALITAELSGMTPDTNEGIFLWIEMGFKSKTLSFSAAVVYFLTYLVDLSLYANLFATYFSQFYPALFTGHVYTFSVVIGLVAVVTVLAILGVDVIGNLSVVVAILITSPFLVTLVWGGVRGWIDPARDWTAPPPGPFGNLTWADASARPQLEAINRGLHVVIWSYTGYDSLGNIVTTLSPPHHFPRAVLGAIVLSFLTYSTALVGLLGAPDPASGVPNFALWKAGHFSEVALLLGGYALQTVMTLAALLSCYGTFQALMVPVGEQLCELTSPKYLDIRLFQRKTRFGTPHIAIAFCALVCVGCSALPLEGLIDSLNILHSTVLFLVCLSYVVLRFSARGQLLPRPFRAVASNALVLPLVLCPLAISAWMVIGISWLTTWVAAAASAGIYAVGVALYFSCRLRKQRGWLWATPVDGAEVVVSQHEHDDSPLLGRRKVNLQ